MATLIQRTTSLIPEGGFEEAEERNTGPIVTGNEYNRDRDIVSLLYGKQTLEPADPNNSGWENSSRLSQEEVDYITNHPLYTQLMNFDSFSNASVQEKRKMLSDAINNSNTTLFENTGEITDGPLGSRERTQLNPETNRREVVPDPNSLFGNNPVGRTVDDAGRRIVNATTDLASHVTGGAIPDIDYPLYPQSESFAENLAREAATEGAGYAFGSLAAKALGRVLGFTGRTARIAEDVAGNVGVAAFMDDNNDSLTEYAAEALADMDIDRNVGQYADNQLFSLGVVAATGLFRVIDKLPLGQIASRVGDSIAGRTAADHIKPSTVLRSVMETIDEGAAGVSDSELLPRIEAFGRMLSRDRNAAITATLLGDKATIDQILNTANFPDTVVSQVNRGAREYVEEVYSAQKSQMDPAQWESFVTSRASEMQRKLIGLVQSRVGVSDIVRQSETGMNSTLRDMLDQSARALEPAGGAKATIDDFVDEVTSPLMENSQKVTTAFNDLEVATASLESVETPEDIVRLFGDDETTPNAILDIIDEYKNGRGTQLFDAWKARRDEVKDAFANVDSGVEIPGGEDEFTEFVRDTYNVPVDEDELPSELLSILGRDWGKESHDMKDLLGAMQGIGNKLGELKSIVQNGGYTPAIAEEMDRLNSVTQYIRGLRDDVIDENDSFRVAFETYDQYARDFLSGSPITDAIPTFSRVRSGATDRETGELATTDSAIRAANKVWQQVSNDTSFLKDTADLADLTPEESNLAVHEFMKQAIMRAQEGNLSLSELPRMLETVGDRLKALDPERYSTLRQEVQALAASDVSATRSREALDRAMIEYTNARNDAENQYITKFLENEGILLPDQGIVASPTGATIRPDTENAVRQIMSGQNAATLTRQIMEASADRPEVQNALKSMFFRYSIDQIFSGKTINIGARTAAERAEDSAYQLRDIMGTSNIPVDITKDIRESMLFKSLNDMSNNNYFAVMSEVFKDDPQVMEAMGALIEEVYARTVPGTMTSRNVGSNTFEKTMNAVSTSESVRKSVQDAVLLAFGPLTRTGAIINTLTRRAVGETNRELVKETFTNMFDTLITDPDAFIDAARLASEEINEATLKDFASRMGINFILRPTVVGEMEGDEPIDEQTDGALNGR